VLYALTLVLQPVLAVVLTLAALWGLCKAFLWLIVCEPKKRVDPLSD